MDIIAAHQQGLIEKLAEETAALAGRPKDFGQRAVVLHHLYDHSRGNHHWALAEARRELHIAAALDRLRRRLSRWGWLASRRQRAASALEGLAEAMGEQSLVRCGAAYTAYRLAGARSLRDEGERRLPHGLLNALAACHAARRELAPMADHDREALFHESERLAAASHASDAVKTAWLAIEATGLRRVAHRIVGDKALDRSFARDRRKGWIKTETALRQDPVLPSSFRANPAQHFYALQNLLAERRRQKWREQCDREPDAFELAA